MTARRRTAAPNVSYGPCGGPKRPAGWARNRKNQRMTISSSPYTGARDLRAMQDLAARLWSPASRRHVGDLAWERHQHTGREPEWPTRLWRSGGRTVAWGWIELPGHLDLMVDPACPGLADEVLAWFAETAPAAPARPAAPGAASPGTGARRTVMAASSEPHLLAALDRHGYRRDDTAPWFCHMARELDRLPVPRVPAGYRLRTVTSADVPARVLAHRAAFHPSRVTEESYLAVRAAWPYRPDLDWIAEAPDGSAAAFCLAWLDPSNAAAAIEPAGTAPEHRRLGLARAVCLAALHAAREAGARRAVVGPRGDDGHPVPGRLYRGLGFEPLARSDVYRREE